MIERTDEVATHEIVRGPGSAAARAVETGRELERTDGRAAPGVDDPHDRATGDEDAPARIEAISGRFTVGPAGGVVVGAVRLTGSIVGTRLRQSRPSQVGYTMVDRVTNLARVRGVDRKARHVR